MITERPRPPCVLVVEEEAGVRDLLQLGLEAHGFTVLPVASGEKAINLFRLCAAEIDVVLLDVGMKEMNGPETLAALRGLAPDLRSCFMTGGQTGDVAGEMSGPGVSPVIAKPFSLDEVADALWGLVGRRLP